MWVSTALRLIPRVPRWNRDQRFNPDVGFYRLATGQHDERVSPRYKVSIPMWVSTALRQGLRCRDVGAGSRVSIPMWVSTALRRSAHVPTSSSTSGFNPGVGFYRLATVSPALGRPAAESEVSIPMWVSTALRPPVPPSLTVEATVSIPMWVSTALRPVGS